MTLHLTRNGISPQKVGLLNREQQRVVLAYAASNESKEPLTFWDEGPRGAVLDSFAGIALGAAEKFVKMGASIRSSRNFLHPKDRLFLHSKALNKGETNIPGDSRLHSDNRFAMARLREEGIITLRFTCVSSDGARFLDLTGEQDMETLLDMHRIDDSRFYENELMKYAQINGQIIKQRPWEVIGFCQIVPHEPGVASGSYDRHLASAEFEVKLSSDMHTYIKCGNALTL